MSKSHDHACIDIKLLCYRALSAVANYMSVPMVLTRLEQVMLTEDEAFWHITISVPIDIQETRIYKQVKINANTGLVCSIEERAVAF